MDVLLTGKVVGREARTVVEMIESAGRRMKYLSEVATITYFLGNGVYEPHWRTAEFSTRRLAEQMRDHALDTRASPPRLALVHSGEPVSEVELGFVTVSGDGTDV